MTEDKSSLYNATYSSADLCRQVYIDISYSYINIYIYISINEKKTRKEQQSWDHMYRGVKMGGLS